MSLSAVSESSAFGFAQPDMPPQELTLGPDQGVTFKAGHPLTDLICLLLSAGAFFGLVASILFFYDATEFMVLIYAI